MGLFTQKSVAVNDLHLPSKMGICTPVKMVFKPTCGVNLQKLKYFVKICVNLH